MKASIIGATGYTGVELLRLLAGHPDVEIAYLTSESQTGTDILTVYPQLRRFYSKALVSMEQIDMILAESDVVFVALPHGHAMDVGKKAKTAKARVIDLGADYRFRDPSVYEAWYKVAHTDKDAKAVYGLTELNRADVKGAKLLANPGCYTTASILALTPLLSEELIDPATIIVDAKSGVTGAGRGLNPGSMFCEVSGNFHAYGVASHRHTPEIEQELSKTAGEAVTISFTPHLLPIDRGILATCYAKVKAGVTAEAISAAFEKAYGDEFFIRLLGQGACPATKNVRGSNFVDLGWQLDARTGRVIVMSAIDNLVKGAAGQAVQNMNVMFGLEETAGLMQAPLYP